MVVEKVEKVKDIVRKEDVEESWAKTTRVKRKKRRKKAE